MRYMDAANVMVPVAACTGLATNEGVTYSNTKLPLNLPPCDNLRKQNGIKQALSNPASVHFLPENFYPFNPWSPPGDQFSPSSKRDVQFICSPNFKQTEEESHFKEGLIPPAEDPKQPLSQCERSCINAFSQSYFPCRLPDVPMNSAEKLAMTGSANPQSDQLTWLSEVASAAAKGALNKHVASSTRNEQPIALPPVLHTVGSDGTSQLLLSNSGSVFSPPIVVTRPVGGNSVRMFSPPFQIEHTRHVQHHPSTIPGAGALYYTQASRTAPMTSFFQATSFPLTASQATLTNTSVNPEAPRSYLQVNNYTSLPGHSVNSPPQHPRSPSYLQHSQSVSSPTNLTIPSSHGRLFPQGRSILISRSPEGMIIHSPHDRDPREQCHVQIQLSPTLPHQPPPEESTRRKSYTSSDSVLGSSSCSPVIETAQSASHNNTDYATQRSSPSHVGVGYRLPTGKEGSLKHRILRPSSINILDPPHSVVADAPLSAPPIRTHREPSPKQARSIPSSGYRSFSSSASSINDVPTHVVASPSSTFPNHCSSFSSGSPSPAPPSSPGAAAQLKYPQSFMKGAIIQLANNKLKHVEDMTTEDFIECSLFSSTLKIDSSTVVSIEKTPFTGAAKLGFQVGQDNIQITVEAPLEHPFFVYKQGWSSCSPERSAQRYGLTCHRLKVGDVCISLTDKQPHSAKPSGQKVTNTFVPTVNVTDSNQNASTERTVKIKKGAADVIHLPSNVDSPSSKLDTASQSRSNSRASGKRKRRWSAPDNLSQNEDEELPNS